MGQGRDDRLVGLVRGGADDGMLSTNLRVKIDGLPYSNQKEPEDPGIAVYFDWEGQQRALASMHGIGWPTTCGPSPSP